jgi:hypothetical protein
VSETIAAALEGEIAIPIEPPPFGAPEPQIHA